ncbi:hypothetical protein ACEPAF_1324 [Sanghuangporus sanghuang]
MSLHPSSRCLSTSVIPANSFLPTVLKNRPGLILTGTILVVVLLFPLSSIFRLTVPAVGSSQRITSYFLALKLIVKMREMHEEGYKKYSTFKIPKLVDRWIAIVNTPELIEEVCKSPEHRLSDEWMSLKAEDVAMQVIARTSNGRVFVGLPLCRDMDYIDINTRYTLDVVKDSVTINLFPEFLKSLVSEFLTPVPCTTRRAIDHLKPVIEYHLSQIDKFGKDWPGKPNDMLSWMMVEASDNEKRDVESLTLRILHFNFAASFTHTLLALVSRPEDIKHLRKEVERVVREEGWSSSDSFAKIRRIDNYLKETLRFYGISITSTLRKAMVDYTLGDGTFIPAGTHTSPAMEAARIMMSEANETPTKLMVSDSLHSTLKLLKRGATEETKDQVVSPTPEFLTFGYGRHTCPGRFFAANELKTMLAYLVLNYDMKLEGEQERPKLIRFAFSCIPNPNGRVLFRKRSSPS